MAAACSLSASAVHADAPRHRLIVYYANETAAPTAASDNYATLLRILRTDGSPAAMASVEELALEARVSLAVSIRDGDILRRYASRVDADISLFSNTAALTGVYGYQRRSEADVEWLGMPWMLPAANRIMASSPLARVDVFRAALEAATSRYPAGTLDVVLIVKSHGTPDMALTPRLSADMSMTDEAEVIRQFLAPPQVATPVPWARIQGIDKLAFWQVLADLGERRGVRFPLVFREVCESGLVNWAEFAAVPANVGLIAHSAMDSMSSAAIDLSSLTSGNSAANDWVMQIVSVLGGQGVHLDRKLTIWRWLVLDDMASLPVAVYFVPLVLWLGWQAHRYFGERSRVRERMPPQPG